MLKSLYIRMVIFGCNMLMLLFPSVPTAGSSSPTSFMQCTKKYSYETPMVAALPRAREVPTFASHPYPKLKSRACDVSLTGPVLVPAKGIIPTWALVYKLLYWLKANFENTLGPKPIVDNSKVGLSQ